MLSPEELATLEAKVRASPEDWASRLRLLSHYREFANFPINDGPATRAARLQHIIYLVEHHPEAIGGGSELAYVFRSGSQYASEEDHELLRRLWLRQIEVRPNDVPVLLSAVSFLFVEHKAEAEEQLKHGIAGNPRNHRIAANLGFLYAMGILGMHDFAGNIPIGESEAARAVSVQRVTRIPIGESDAARAETVQRVTRELESCSNAAVLAGAATALQNLAIRASRGAQVNPEVVEFAAKLMARARALEPVDEAFRGPMPMIQYFAEAARNSTDSPFFSSVLAEPIVNPPSPPDFIPPRGQPPALPTRIRVGADLQAAKLVRSTPPVYPEQARQSAISGDVRLSAVIGRDGTIEQLVVLSGHPLLIPSALEAVKQWVYQPTELNGSPVEVVTEIIISFPPNEGRTRP